jgi:uncharacterized protein YecT (DUF1311 family)
MRHRPIGRYLILAGTLLAFLWAPAAGIAQDDKQAESACMKADKELNRVYKKVRVTYKDDPLFLTKLKVAQRAWVKFRDGHMDSRYPLVGQYGSDEADCACWELAEITAARTEQLKKWLKGAVEGHGCSGSYKWDHDLAARGGASTARLAKAAPSAPEVSRKSATQAQEIFQNRCAVCHGAKGKGKWPGSAALDPKPPNFTSVKWQKSVTDEHIQKLIVYGGLAVGLSPTCPSNPDLDANPEVVDGLLAFIRSIGMQK